MGKPSIKDKYRRLDLIEMYGELRHHFPLTVAFILGPLWYPSKAVFLGDTVPLPGLASGGAHVNSSFWLKRLSPHLWANFPLPNRNNVLLFLVEMWILTEMVTSVMGETGCQNVKFWHNFHSRCLLKLKHSTLTSKENESLEPQQAYSNQQPRNTIDETKTASHRPGVEPSINPRSIRLPCFIDFDMLY